MGMWLPTWMLSQRKSREYGPIVPPPERKKRTEYESHQDLYGGFNVTSGMKMQQVETINYAMRRCKIGKITMKA